MKNKIDLLKAVNYMLFFMLLIAAVLRFGIFKADAAAAWKGFAVYRNGVLANINDHAALMCENSYSSSKPVVHAPGYGESVKKGTWSEFKNGHSYIATYKPNDCVMTSTVKNSFVSKALELQGISYTVLDQIDYSAGNSYWVKPEHITDLRCDGVVEYVYEWYGYRVCGSQLYWNISRNLTSNKTEHSGTNFTPRKQRKYYLEHVTDNLPN
jgi:hypothetical protein